MCVGGGDTVFVWLKDRECAPPVSPARTCLPPPTHRSDAVSDKLKNPWADRIVLNKSLFGGKYGELDLALAKNLINCARIIVRKNPAGGLTL